MLTLNQVKNYWQYSLSIERSLERTTDFVEVCSDNDMTYSFEYAKIIMLACSEIDVLCRILCKEISQSSDFESPDTRTGNIKRYAEIILPKFPKLTTFEFYNTKKQCNIIPFDGWVLSPTYCSPVWWDDYQLIKHYRHSEYTRATQSNAFHSMAGLITLNLYLHRLIADKPYANPYPQPNLFNTSVFSPFMLCRANDELPDFEAVVE